MALQGKLTLLVSESLKHLPSVCDTSRQGSRISVSTLYRRYMHHDSGGSSFQSPQRVEFADHGVWSSNEIRDVVKYFPSTPDICGCWTARTPLKSPLSWLSLNCCWVSCQVQPVLIARKYCIVKLSLLKLASSVDLTVERRSCNRPTVINGGQFTDVHVITNARFAGKQSRQKWTQFWHESN